MDKVPKLLQEEFPVGLKTQVLAEVQKAVKAAGFDEKLVLDHPTDPQFGDYTTNIALALASKDTNLKASEVAQKIIAKIELGKSQLLAKAEEVKGFINLWLKKEALVSQLRQVIRLKEKFGSAEFLKDKQVLLEHTSPDPIKTIHIGHLRNNFLGMAVSRILTSLGAQVVMDCINNDRGTHVSRAMFGYLVFARKNLNLPRQDLLNFKVTDAQVKQVAERAEWQQLLDDWLTKPEDWYQPEDLKLKSDHLDLIFYSLGDRSERLVEKVKDQVRQMLRDWEAEKAKVRALWRQIIDWSLAGYALTYKRIGSHHDRIWHESDLYKGGKELVKQGLQKGVFKESQGAVVTDLAKYQLPDTVVMKSDGTALYHTFDLYFTAKKRQVFPSDLYIWDIGNDQLLYLKQLFAMCEQLGIGKVEDYYHLNFGYVTLKGGKKMSSRQGTIVSVDELLDFLKQKARLIMLGAETQTEDFTPDQIDKISEKVGLAAINYGLLKTSRTNDMQFDPETSVNLSGDSGPYLQYTFARAQSVLKKALEKKVIFSLSEYDLFRGKLAGMGPGRFPFPPRSSARPGQPMPVRLPIARSSIPVKKPGLSPKPELELALEEEMILRTAYRYSEVVVEAAKRLEPALICHFLYDLAQKFNTFYNKHPIMPKTPRTVAPPQARDSSEVDRDTASFRLALTASVGQILKNGLVLLGIDPLEKM